MVSSISTTTSSVMNSQSPTSLSLETGVEQAQEVWLLLSSYPSYLFLDTPWTSTTTSQLVFTHTEPQLVPVSLVLAERAASTQGCDHWEKNHLGDWLPC